MFFSRLVVSVNKYLPSIIFFEIRSDVTAAFIFSNLSAPSPALILARVEESITCLPALFTADTCHMRGCRNACMRCLDADLLPGLCLIFYTDVLG